MKNFKNTAISLIALFTILTGVSLAIMSYAPVTQPPIKGAVTIPNYSSSTRGALQVGIWKSNARSASGFDSVVMRRFSIPLTQKASDVIIPLDYSGVRLSNGTYYITAAAYTDALKALSSIPPNSKVTNTNIFKYGEYSEGKWGNPSPITYSGDQLVGLDFTLNMSPALITEATMPTKDTLKPPVDTTLPPKDWRESTTTTTPTKDTLKPPVDTTLPPKDWGESTTTTTPTKDTLKPPTETTVPPTTITTVRSINRPFTFSSAFNGTITFTAPVTQSVLFVGVWPSTDFSSYSKALFYSQIDIPTTAISAVYSVPLYPRNIRAGTEDRSRPIFANGTNYYIAAYLLIGRAGFQRSTSGPFPVVMQEGYRCGQFSDGNKPGNNATPLLFQGTTISSDFNLNYVIQSSDLY